MSESGPRPDVVSAVRSRALWPWAAVTVVLTVGLSSYLILHDGRHGWVAVHATAEAQPRLEDLLAPQAGALADGVRLEGQFDP